MLSNILEISLAVAGLVFLIRYTDGPKDIFLDFRIWIGIYELQQEDGSFTEVIEEKFFAKLFACHWCLTTWIVPIALLRFIGIYDIVTTIFMWLSCIFVTGFLLESVLLIRRING